MKSEHPNRFFGSNPVSAPANGRKEEGLSSELPRTWRSALGLDGPPDAAPGAGAAQTTAWSDQPRA